MRFKSNLMFSNKYTVFLSIKLIEAQPLGKFFDCEKIRRAFRSPFRFVLFYSYQRLPSCTSEFLRLMNAALAYLVEKVLKTFTVRLLLRQ